jgi:quercetin dioxygenase-like cupin family protein
MRTTFTAGALLTLVALGAPARAAQELDSPKADPRHHKVELENEWVRVVRWKIPPHGKTALHDHPGLVNVLLTDGGLRIVTPDGTASEVHLKAGSASWRDPTVHVAANDGDQPVEGILVEPKAPGRADWAPPPRDAVAVAGDKVELENDQVRVVRFVIDKGARVPMHEHPAGVHIVLTDFLARQTTPDGKTSDLPGKAGTVRFRPAVTHAEENLGDRYEGILVDIKAVPAAAR